jgi:hypothetical protein
MLPAIATGLTVGALLNQVEDKANKLINSAGNEARESIFAAAQAILIIINQLKLSFNEVLDKTFDQLNSAQREAFQNTWVTLEKIDKMAEKGIADVHEITEMVSLTMKESIFGDDTPRVINIKPHYIAKGQIQNETLIIEGLLIGEGTPKLILAGQELPLVAKDDTRLEFALGQLDISNVSDQIAPIIGELTLFEKKSFWDFLSEPPIRSYKILVFCLPQYALQVQIDCIVKEQYSEEREFQFPPASEVRYEAGSHYSETSETFQYPVPEGWNLDTSTLRWHEGPSDNGNFRGFGGSNGRWCAITLWATPHGKTPNPFDPKRHEDLGYITGHATGIARRTPTREKKVVLEQGKRQEWAQELKWDLPAGSTGFIATIRTVDGRERIIDKPEESDRFFSISYNAGTRVLIIRPRDIDTIVRK